jgi:hypothetical protein
MLSGGRWISYSDENSEQSSIASSAALFDGITQQVQLFETGQVIRKALLVITRMNIPGWILLP